MKTAFLLPFVALIFGAPTSNAQISAGDVPQGWSVAELDINLYSDSNTPIDSASFDLDCDGVNDILALLIQGAPEVDGPHICSLRSLSTDLEICADSTNYHSVPHYYDPGQLLSCMGDPEWRSDSMITLSINGGFIPIGPAQVATKFIAYRKAGLVGWINLSFDLSSGLSTEPINMQVHEVLLPCIANGILQLENVSTLSIYPSVTRGEEIRINNGNSIVRIAVLDASGRMVYSDAGTIRTIPAPTVSGLYFVQAILHDGTRAIARLVRH